MRKSDIALRLASAFLMIGFTIMITHASVTWAIDLYAGSGQEPAEMQGYKIVHKVEPVYPLTAKSGVVDPVRVRVEVDEAGNVVAALVLEGHPLLNQLALDAIKQWKFEPVLVGGTPIPFLTSVRVDFQGTGSPKIDVAVARLLARINVGKPSNAVEGQFVSDGRAQIALHVSEDSAQTRSQLLKVGFVTNPRQFSSALVGQIPVEQIPRLLTLRFVQFIGASSLPMRGGTVLEQKIIRQVEPSFPTSAPKVDTSAQVQLEITIDEFGNVSEAHIVQGRPLLNKAAIEAVGQWKYSPFYMNMIPIPVIKKVTVTFKNDRTSGRSQK